MDSGFIDILKLLIAEQGKSALTDRTKGRAFLSDYTGNEYKKEKRQILLAIEEGMAKTIDEANDLEPCKKACIRDLNEDYSLDTNAAQDIINTLALVLRGDTTVTAPPTAAARTTPTVIVKKPIPANKKVELSHVGKVYKTGVRALDDVSLVVGEKEFVVLLGKTGSGKSTLLNIIAGHEEMTSGKLIIDGEDVKINPPKPYICNAAMVAQDYAYDEDGTKLPVLDMVHSRARLNRGALSFQMSVYENMAYGLKKYKCSRDEIDRRVKWAAELLDIEKLQYRKPKALSIGQRWRTAFGCALCYNPKVYLFDEPLWKIDAENHASALRASFREELISIHRRLNMTTIYATPDEDKAWTDIADRVIIIKDGRIQ